MITEELMASQIPTLRVYYFTKAKNELVMGAHICISTQKTEA